VLDDFIDKFQEKMSKHEGQNIMIDEHSLEEGIDVLTEITMLSGTGIRTQKLAYKEEDEQSLEYSVYIVAGQNNWFIEEDKKYIIELLPRYASYIHSMTQEIPHNEGMVQIGQEYKKDIEKLKEELAQE
jgi:hypothetical protein